MRWIRSRFFLLLLYVAFVVAAGNYVHNALRYSGVEAWPSVSATVTGQTGTEERYPYSSNTGSGSFTLDTRAVQFDYAVNGKSYKGTEYSPNGGGLEQAQDSDWRAFYNPEAPEVAVLRPVPYKGVGWMALAGVTGFMVTVQLHCAALDFFDRRRKRRRRVH